MFDGAKMTAVLVDSAAGQNFEMKLDYAAVAVVAAMGGRNRSEKNNWTTTREQNEASEVFELFSVRPKDAGPEDAW